MTKDACGRFGFAFCSQNPIEITEENKRQKNFQKQVVLERDQINIEKTPYQMSASKQSNLASTSTCNTNIKDELKEEDIDSRIRMLQFEFSWQENTHNANLSRSDKDDIFRATATFRPSESSLSREYVASQ